MTADGVTVTGPEAVSTVVGAAAAAAGSGVRAAGAVATPAAVAVSAGAVSPRNAAISASLARISADVPRSRSMAWVRSGWSSSPRSASAYAAWPSSRSAFLRSFCRTTRRA